MENRPLWRRKRAVPAQHEGLSYIYTTSVMIFGRRSNRTRGSRILVATYVYRFKSRVVNHTGHLHPSHLDLLPTFAAQHDRYKLIMPVIA
jgi:hypothetical protein